MNEWCPKGQRFVDCTESRTLTEDDNGSFRIYVTGGECLRLCGTEERARMSTDWPRRDR